MVINSIKNSTLIVVDAAKDLALDPSLYPNYYTDNFNVILDKLTEYFTKLIERKQTKEGIILIYGLNKFITKLNDNTKLNEFIKKVKEYEKMGIVIVDDASKIKQYAFETWFNGTFSINDGIFIGRGVSDQNLLHLSTVTREMSKDIKNDMAYLISEGYATLFKTIDFISEEGDSFEK